MTQENDITPLAHHAVTQTELLHCRLQFLLARQASADNSQVICTIDDMVPAHLLSIHNMPLENTTR